MLEHLGIEYHDSFCAFIGTADIGELPVRNEACHGAWCSQKNHNLCSKEKAPRSAKGDDEWSSVKSPYIYATFWKPRDDVSVEREDVSDSELDDDTFAKIPVETVRIIELLTAAEMDFEMTEVYQRTREGLVLNAEHITKVQT